MKTSRTRMKVSRCTSNVRVTAATPGERGGENAAMSMALKVSSACRPGCGWATSWMMWSNSPPVMTIGENVAPRIRYRAAWPSFSHVRPSSFWASFSRWALYTGAAPGMLASCWYPWGAADWW
ncbi:unnamed protein product [Ectocarpus sp. CCAP 1310/34]|nr:unnamed protein product [Ectocarpus sp. CCAP 1310/34]